MCECVVCIYVMCLLCDIYVYGVYLCGVCAERVVCICVVCIVYGVCVCGVYSRMRVPCVSMWYVSVLCVLYVIYVHMVYCIYICMFSAGLYPCPCIYGGYRKLLKPLTYLLILLR